MSRPLFAVGEIVVLQSKTAPEFNGEYMVLAYVEPGKVYFDPVAKQRVMCACGGCGYILDCGSSVSLSDGATHGARIWAESALRKRHQPGEYSFDGLKQILALPVSRGDFA